MCITSVNYLVYSKFRLGCMCEFFIQIQKFSGVKMNFCLCKCYILNCLGFIKTLAKLTHFIDSILKLNHKLTSAPNRDNNQVEIVSSPQAI